MTRRPYPGTDLELSVDADLCIHATECVRGLPSVFDRSRRPWILADNSGADQVSSVVDRMTAARHEPSSRTSGDRRDVSVDDNADASRFELRFLGQLAGYATCRDLPSGRAFEHTVIASEFVGLGLASRLIRHAVVESETAGLRVLPFCPFVRAYLQRHPEYLTQVDQPQRFGLT